MGQQYFNHLGQASSRSVFFGDRVLASALNTAGPNSNNWRRKAKEAFNCGSYVGLGVPVPALHLSRLDLLQQVQYSLIFTI